MKQADLFSAPQQKEVPQEQAPSTAGQADSPGSDGEAVRAEASPSHPASAWDKPQPNGEQPFVGRGLVPRRDGATALPPAAGLAKTPAWRREADVDGAATREVLTVTELTLRIKGVLEPRFSRLLVRGEIANFRGPNARGHLFFNLKDEGATLPIAIWAGQARGMKFTLQEGLAVVVEGNLSVYEPHGNYRLIAQRLEPEGVGALALAFEQLKKKLAAEGLFGPLRTRPARALPVPPRRIGVVTSLSGAALRDFLTVLYRRHPRLAVLVCDARVQGEGAAADVCRGLRWLAKTDVDVIVVTRGGGSMEDLWTFNEESVVRAIFASRVPVVSAIGHEIDTTLSDLVADFRAPTPSAAAEALAPELGELVLGLAVSRQRLRKALQVRLLHHRRDLQAQRVGLGDPRLRLSRAQFALSDASDRLERRLRASLEGSREGLSALTDRLQRARPQAQLRAQQEALQLLSRRLSAAMRARLRAERSRAGPAAIALERVSPRPRLAQERLRLQRSTGRLAELMRRRVEVARERFGAAGQQLTALSPLAVLARGYALVQREDGRVVRRALDVVPGELVRLRLGGGDVVVAEVKQVKPGDGQLE